MATIYLLGKRSLVSSLPNGGKGRGGLYGEVVAVVVAAVVDAEGDGDGEGVVVAGVW